MGQGIQSSDSEFSYKEFRSEVHTLYVAETNWELCSFPLFPSHVHSQAQETHKGRLGFWSGRGLVLAAKKLHQHLVGKH